MGEAPGASSLRHDDGTGSVVAPRLRLRQGMLDQRDGFLRPAQLDQPVGIVARQGRLDTAEASSDVQGLAVDLYRAQRLPCPGERHPEVVVQPESPHSVPAAERFQLGDGTFVFVHRFGRLTHSAEG